MTREEALKRVKGYLTDYISADCYGEVEEIMEALEQELCGDCISRQAVLALPTSKTRTLSGEIVEEEVNIELIKALPSVVPKEKTVIETLEKMKEEIKQIRLRNGYIDVQGLTIIKVLEIIDRHLSEMKNEIKNGIALPDNITNGDVIKAIFPNLEQDKERLIQQYGSQSLYDTYEKWCKLPYKCFHNHRLTILYLRGTDEAKELEVITDDN